jgi:hypothetical protein
MTTTSIPVTAVSRKPLYTFLGLVSVGCDPKFTVWAELKRLRRFGRLDWPF